VGLCVMAGVGEMAWECGGGFGGGLGRGLGVGDGYEEVFLCCFAILEVEGYGWIFEGRML
jgi:hypothetical protein